MDGLKFMVSRKGSLYVKKILTKASRTLPKLHTQLPNLFVNRLVLQTLVILIDPSYKAIKSSEELLFKTHLSFQRGNLLYKRSGKKLPMLSGKGQVDRIGKQYRFSLKNQFKTQFAHSYKTFAFSYQLFFHF